MTTGARSLIAMNHDRWVADSAAPRHGGANPTITHAHEWRLGHLTGYHETSGTSEGGGWHFQGALTGTGAYEGLTALVLLVPSAGTETSGWDVHGMVFPGELPEAPAHPEPAE